MQTAIHSFLKKLKLLDILVVELEFTKNEFIDRFSKQVDAGNTGIFAGTFDVFSSGKNEYMGYVGIDSFKIRRRKRLFDMRISMATATGTYRQHDDMLIIETSINGFSKKMIPFYLFAIFLYLVMIGSVSLLDTGNTARFFIIPFVLIHAAFMLGIPYLMMRYSVSTMKHDLEREFFFVTKKSVDR